MRLADGLHRGLIICGVLVLFAASARSQTSAEIAMIDGNPQLSRVFTTLSADAPPQQWLWKSEKLFEIRYSYPISYIGPTITVAGTLPTHHSFTFPIVSDGIVYFTLFVNNSYFYAIDANTGKPVLTLKFDKTRLSAPAAIGRVAFFGSSNGNFYAYDMATRERKWVHEGEGPSLYSAPVIDDGVVYISGSRDGIIALSAETGNVKWRIKAGQLLHRPAIKGDNLVVYGVDGLLISLNKKTGTKNWEAKLERKFTGTAILDDQVFLSHIHGEIRAYALADGALRWKSNRAGGTKTDLALFKDAVIYGEEGGNIVALDARSGEPKWKFKTKKRCLSPLVAGETVYTSCADHHLYAIDPQTGQMKWKYDWKKNGPLPAVANGVMYFLGSDGILQAAK